MSNNSRNRDHFSSDAPGPPRSPTTGAPSLRREINLTSAIIAAAEAKAARTQGQVAVPSHFTSSLSSFPGLCHHHAQAVSVASTPGFGLAVPFQSPYPHDQQQVHVEPNRRQQNLGPPPGYFQPPDGMAYDVRADAANRRVISDGLIHPEQSQGRDMLQTTAHPHWGVHHHSEAPAVTQIVDHSHLTSQQTPIPEHETQEEKAEREKEEYVTKARKEYNWGRAFEDDDDFYPGSFGRSGRKT